MLSLHFHVFTLLFGFLSPWAPNIREEKPKISNKPHPMVAFLLHDLIYFDNWPNQNSLGQSFYFFSLSGACSCFLISEPWPNQSSLGQSQFRNGQIPASGSAYFSRTGCYNCGSWTHSAAAVQSTRTWLQSNKQDTCKPKVIFCWAN